MNSEAATCLVSCTCSMLTSQISQTQTGQPACYRRISGVDGLFIEGGVLHASKKVNKTPNNSIHPMHNSYDCSQE